MLLTKNNIMTPKTYSANKESISVIGEKLRFPLMLKLVSGSGGKGVMYIEDLNTLNSTVSSLESLKQTMLIQEFVKNKGEDIRIIVCCDEIIGSMKRVITEKGATRSNIKCGNKGEKYSPDMNLKRMAFKCTKLINADMCGVDFIEGRDGNYYCIELNINPGIVGLTATTELNIAKRIVELHSGQINFCKNAKAGTTFTINIPVSEIKGKAVSDNVSDSVSEDSKKI